MLSLVCIFFRQMVCPCTRVLICGRVGIPDRAPDATQRTRTSFRCFSKSFIKKVVINVELFPRFWPIQWTFADHQHRRCKPGSGRCLQSRFLILFCPSSSPFLSASTRGRRGQRPQLDPDTWAEERAAAFHEEGHRSPAGTPVREWNAKTALLLRATFNSSQTTSSQKCELT